MAIVYNDFGRCDCAWRMVLPANSLKTFSEGKDGAVTTPVGSALVHTQLWPGSLRFCSNYVPRRAFFAIFEFGNPEGRNRAQSQALFLWTAGFLFHWQCYASLSRVYAST